MVDGMSKDDLLAFGPVEFLKKIETKLVGQIPDITTVGRALRAFRKERHG